MTPTVFDVAVGTVDVGAVLDVLARRGFLVLRGLFAEADLDDLGRRCDQVLARPAMAGAAGYFVVDYARKVLNPCTALGGPILRVILDERVIECAERAMGSECVLSQAGLRYDRGVGYE